MKKFDELKAEYNKLHDKDKEANCILSVHLTIGKVETKLFKKNGTHSEQYYK